MGGFLNIEYTVTLENTFAESDGMVVGNHDLETRNERRRLLIEFC